MAIPYLDMKHGIKYGDTGLMSRATDRMLAYFHASTSKNYAFRMLFWTHHTRSPASHPDLQRAILLNSLVNISGKEGCWKEIDVYNEHLNKDMKKIFRDRGTSTFDFSYLFQYSSLNSLYFKTLRYTVETLSSVHLNGRHTSKSAADDLKDYAAYLQRTSMRPQLQPQSAIKGAPDLIYKGITLIDKQSIGK